jgi:hypothetical protein
LLQKSAFQNLVSTSHQSPAQLCQKEKCQTYMLIWYQWPTQKQQKPQ